MFSFIRHTDKLTKHTKKHNRNLMEFGFKMTHILQLANWDFEVNILIIIQNMKKIYV